MFMVNLFPPQKNILQQTEPTYSFRLHACNDISHGAEHPILWWATATLHQVPNNRKTHKKVFEKIWNYDSANPGKQMHSSWKRFGEVEPKEQKRRLN